VLVGWEVIDLLEMFNPAVFPGPLDVLDVAITRGVLDDLRIHAFASLRRAVIGFTLGAIPAILVGIATGWYRWLGKIVWSPIELLRPIPPLAWIPFALIWFGLGENSKVFIILLTAFFPVVTNTYKGMVSIEPQLIRAAQTMGLKGYRLLWQVAIPAALPDIAIGMRVGISLSFGALMAAEILAAKEGLGAMIWRARDVGGGVAVMVYGIIMIGLLTLFVDFLFNQLVLKRQLRWHFSADADQQ
jgi:ABC-type nitrate/sulfonate/bicarbonate transport system permease component